MATPFTARTTAAVAISRLAAGGHRGSGPPRRGRHPGRPRPGPRNGPSSATAPPPRRPARADASVRVEVNDEPLMRTTRAETTASTERTKAPAISSGTRKRRSLATRHLEGGQRRRRARRPWPPVATRPRARCPGPGAVAMPQGTKRSAKRATSTARRIDSPSLTRARSGPAYSRTMASWIIVSSRWVLGLSTGRRPLSATITMTKATRASRRCGVASQSGMGERAGDDGGQVGGVGGHREGQDGDQQGRLGQRPDGHGPAGSHATEGGPGVEGARGRGRPSRAAGGRRRRRGRQTTRRPGSVASSGAMAATTKVRGHQHQRGQGEDPARLLGPGPLPAGQLAQVEQGLADRGPDPALQSAAHLAHQPDQERAPDHDADHLEQRDRRHRGDRPGRRSSHHHQDHDERHQAEGQVAVHAPVGHPPGQRPPTS